MDIRSVPRSVPRARSKRRSGRAERSSGPPQPPLGTPARGRLFVEPEQVRAAADRLSALGPRLGGVLADLTLQQRHDQEQRWVVQVDPLVGHTAEVVRQDLLRYEEVRQAAQLDPAAHAARADQVRAAETAYLNAQQRAIEVEDSLRAVGHDNRQMRLALREAIPRALEQALVPEPLRPTLRSLWTALQAEEAKRAEQLAAARRQSAAAGQQAAAELEQRRRQEEMVRTMLELRQDQPRGEVDPWRTAAAARTYQEVQRAAEAAAARALAEDPERRDAPR
ncbi:MAG: hypothetical protein RMK29_13375 [Myxococcales bacterium]|nr:hypothetical protein [Myxococcota bacterium]MDW8282698.1 hypothetical protein [Myxococcales bacterium]